MARGNKASTPGGAAERIKRSFVKSIDQVQSLIDDLSVSMYGRTTEDESDKLNDRFNEIMSSEINNITGNGSNDYNSFLGQVFASGKDEMNSMKDINAKLDLDIRGNGINPTQYINEQYKNRMVQQADAEQISNQLIELKEAKSVMRDAIISTDLNTGRINRIISFATSTTNDISGRVTPVIEEMEKKFNLHARIKNIVDKTLGFGEYYVYSIPYHEVFENFARKYKRGMRNGRNFFESADDSITVEDIEVKFISESPDVDKVFMENAESYISEEIGYDKSGEDKANIKSDLNSLIKTDRITITTEPIPLPILEEGMESMAAFADMYITEDGDMFTEAGVDKKSSKKKPEKKQNKRGTKDGEKLQTDEDTFLRKYGEGEDGVYNQDGILKEKKDKPFEDMKDCYIKEVSPIQMIPVKIMGKVLFYLYIQTESAAPLSTILSYQTQFRAKDPANRVDNLVDDIANRIVGKFSQEFVSKNKEFKELIASALQYYELGNTKIHFQVVPREYVTAFKINKDEDDNGHSMLEPSLFYAKLYLMLLMFKIVTIITKSNDQEINYIRTSGIDKNVYNKAQRIARQKQARRITINDMFSYTGVINKIGSGNAIYMPMGKNNEKPIETEILQGQSVELNNDLMEMLRTNYILASGVPSAIMNYLNEADFAKSIETANTKMNGRVINYQIDLNDPVTELYQKLLHFTSHLEDSEISSVRVKFAEPKGASNVTTEQLIQNYSSLQDFLVKLYFGESPTDDDHVKAFMSELARMHLPMINFDKIDEIFKSTKIDSTEKKINPVDDLADDPDYQG